MTTTHCLMCWFLPTNCARMRAQLFTTAGAPRWKVTVLEALIQACFLSLKTTMGNRKPYHLESVSLNFFEAWCIRKRLDGRKICATHAASITHELFPLQALILDTFPCLMYLGGMQQWSFAAADVTQLALGWQNVQSLSDANVQLCDTSRSGKRPRWLLSGVRKTRSAITQFFGVFALHRKILLTFPHVHGESLQSFFCLSQSHIGKYIFWVRKHTKRVKSWVFFSALCELKIKKFSSAKNLQFSV